MIISNKTNVQTLPNVKYGFHLVPIYNVGYSVEESQIKADIYLRIMVYVMVFYQIVSTNHFSLPTSTEMALL